MPENHTVNASNPSPMMQNTSPVFAQNINKKMYGLIKYVDK
jgi:hypothetical protein